jgi:hypothetical protein
MQGKLISILLLSTVAVVQCLPTIKTINSDAAQQQLFKRKASTVSKATKFKKGTSDKPICKRGLLYRRGNCFSGITPPKQNGFVPVNPSGATMIKEGGKGKNTLDGESFDEIHENLVDGVPPFSFPPSEVFSRTRPNDATGEPSTVESSVTSASGIDSESGVYFKEPASEPSTVESTVTSDTDSDSGVYFKQI